MGNSEVERKVPGSLTYLTSSRYVLTHTRWPEDPRDSKFLVFVHRACRRVGRGHVVYSCTHVLRAFRLAKEARWYVWSGVAWVAWVFVGEKEDQRVRTVTNRPPTITV